MGKEAFFLKHIFVLMDCIMAGQGMLTGEEAGVVIIKAKLTRMRLRRTVAEVISWGRRGSQVNNDVPGDSKKAKVKVTQSEALSSPHKSSWRSLSRRSLLPQPGSLSQASCWASVAARLQTVAYPLFAQEASWEISECGWSAELTHLMFFVWLNT